MHTEPLPLESIAARIFIVRGQRVMLDTDLAELYDVETRVLNQAVKRNPERFPVDFMMQVTENEYERLRSQSVTLNDAPTRGRHRKYLPYVFTEHGAVMLARPVAPAGNKYTSGWCGRLSIACRCYRLGPAARRTGSPDGIPPGGNRPAHPNPVRCPAPTAGQTRTAPPRTHRLWHFG